MASVSATYLSVALMVVISIAVPVGAWFAGRFFRPMVDPTDPTKTRIYFTPGYEVDHTLYRRRLSTYECGSEPIGSAMIQFHFQYYWYAIVFLVFDVAFMVLALGGVLAVETTDAGGVRRVGLVERAEAGLVTASAFLAIMLLGVWHVFRKRGRIYI